MRKVVPTRAVALVVIAFFGFHLSRFYLVADLTNFVCPHHVQTLGSPEGAPQHAGHEMGESHAAHPGTQPADSDSGLRCCCRHSLDGLITTLILDTPADPANLPLPEGVRRVSLSAEPSIAENDLSPPFEPPRV